MMVFSPSLLLLLVLPQQRGAAAETPPFPWADGVQVSRDGKRATIARRELAFSTGPLPASIAADRHAVLSSHAVVAVDGCAWTAAKLLPRSATPLSATWHSYCVTAANSTVVSATSTLHYDGWLSCELDVAASVHETGGAAVAVKLPMRKELLYNHGFVGWHSDWNARYDFRYTPELEAWSGAVPADGFNLSFTPELWLGDNQGRGLSFLCDGPSNWSLPAGMKERPAMVVSNDKDSTLLTVTLLEKTTSAAIQSGGGSGGATAAGRHHTLLRFGLMPTPVRPLPTRPDLRNPKISPACVPYLALQHACNGSNDAASLTYQITCLPA
jgi:hypothetical protein